MANENTRCVSTRLLRRPASGKACEDTESLLEGDILPSVGGQN